MAREQTCGWDPRADPRSPSGELLPHPGRHRIIACWLTLQALSRPPRETMSEISPYSSSGEVVKRDPRSSKDSDGWNLRTLLKICENSAPRLVFPLQAVGIRQDLAPTRTNSTVRPQIRREGVGQDLASAIDAGLHGLHGETQDRGRFLLRVALERGE